MEKTKGMQEEMRAVSREMEISRENPKEMLTSCSFTTPANGKIHWKLNNFVITSPGMLHTPFFLVNSLRYFIYQIYFLAKYFNKVIHFHEFLWAAFHSPHRQRNGSDRLAHSAE